MVAKVVQGMCFHKNFSYTAIKLETVLSILTLKFFYCIQIYVKKKKKSKAIPVTGHGGLKDCEMLRIPHCLDSQLRNGSKIVSLMHRPHSTSKKHYFSASGTHFC
jgi:hypothetical protein